MTAFYRGTVKSILTYCIIVWYENCSAATHKSLQRIKTAAEKIIGVSLLSVADIYMHLCQEGNQNNDWPLLFPHSAPAIWKEVPEHPCNICQTAIVFPPKLSELWTLSKCCHPSFPPTAWDDICKQMHQHFSTLHCTYAALALCYMVYVFEMCAKCIYWISKWQPDQWRTVFAPI